MRGGGGLYGTPATYKYVVHEATTPQMFTERIIRNLRNSDGFH